MTRKLGLCYCAFLLFWMPSSSVEVSITSSGHVSVAMEKDMSRMMRQERKQGKTRIAKEPSDAKVNLNATKTAMSLLSKFRVCGHGSLIRMGPMVDGGYLIPSATSNVGPMISIGVRGDDPFSHAMTHKYGIKAHLYDCFSGPSPCPSALSNCDVTFHHVCVGGSDFANQANNTFQTIASIVQQHAPGDSKNLILKIDCEGCEWDAFAAMPNATLDRFSLVVAELHWLEREAEHEKYLSVMTTLTQRFEIVHTHGCNCIGQVHLSPGGYNIPKVVEVTFMRKDLLTSPRDCSTEADYQAGLDHPICPGQSEMYNEVFNVPVEGA